MDLIGLILLRIKFVLQMLLQIVLILKEGVEKARNGK